MIDERDMLIIDILQENARTPYTEIDARPDASVPFKMLLTVVKKPKG